MLSCGFGAGKVLPRIFLLALLLLVPAAAAALDTPLVLKSGCCELYFDSSVSVESAFINKVQHVLNSTAHGMAESFSLLPARPVVFRFLSETRLAELRVPAWMSAVYRNGEITVLLPEERTEDAFAAMARTLRHEYVHVVVAALSNYRCPAWLDEGLAQYYEDPSSIASRAQLFRRLVKDEPIALSALEDNISRLPEEYIPSAYGQSLLAVQLLIEQWGFDAVVSYLSKLGAGMTREKAFKHAFGITPKEFDAMLLMFG